MYKQSVIVTKFAFKGYKHSNLTVSHLRQYGSIILITSLHFSSDFLTCRLHRVPLVPPAPPWSDVAMSPTVIPTLVTPSVISPGFLHFACSASSSRAPTPSPGEYNVMCIYLLVSLCFGFSCFPVFPMIVSWPSFPSGYLHSAGWSIGHDERSFSLVAKAVCQGVE